MSNRTRMKTLCAVAISLTPLLSHAASEQDGVNACAEALTSQLAEMQSAPIEFTIGSDGHFSTRRLDRLNRFFLDARDPQSQEVIARADCIVSWNAEVKRLTMIPLDEHAASLRQLASL